MFGISAARVVFLVAVLALFVVLRVGLEPTTYIIRLEGPRTASRYVTCSVLI
jgi:hypothetical protein